MNPADALMLMIASSSVKSTYEGKRRQAEEVPPQKGPPLPGIKHDLKAFRNKFKLFTNHYIETSQDEGMLLTKAYIMNWLEKYFCEATYQTFIFFSGHGCQGGDWALETVQNPNCDLMRLEAIINLWLAKRPMQKCHLYIIMDSCYSGAWAYKLSDMGNKGVSIFASSDRNETSIDCNGGLLMKSILGPENQIDATYNLIRKYQNPVFINKTDRVSKLQVDHLKQLNKDIGNVMKVLSGGTPFQGLALNGGSIQSQPNPSPNITTNNNNRPPPNNNLSGGGNRPPPPPPPPNNNTNLGGGGNKPPNQGGGGSSIYGGGYEGGGGLSGLSGLSGGGGNVVYVNANDLQQDSNGNYTINGVNIQDFDWSTYNGGGSGGLGAEYDDYGGGELGDDYGDEGGYDDAGYDDYGDYGGYNGRAHKTVSTQTYTYIDANGKKVTKKVTKTKIRRVKPGGGGPGRKGAEENTSANNGPQQTLIYANGQKYRGSVVNGKRQGKGRFQYASGTVYDGEWKMDKKHGYGVCLYSNGEIYEGNWANDLRNGNGAYTYPDGRKYDGDWKDNARSGHGIFYFKNGDQYDGQWANQKQNGQGVYTYKDGKRYQGQFKDGKFHGQGIMDFPNGNRYEGEWKNDKKDGKGKFDLANGDSYDGDWVADVKSGYGVYYYANGDQYEGYFQNNKFNGEGSYFYADGQEETGQWIDDQFQG